MIQEFDAGDPESEDHSWKLHEWTAQETHFAAQVLQHGDVGRAYAEAFKGDSRGRLRFSPECLAKGEELMRRPYIKEYVQFVRDKIRAKMEVAEERILEEVSNMAFSNMADFVVVQEDGTPVFDMSSLTREQWAAVQEMTIETYKEGRGEDAEEVKSFKFKLAPKIAAVQLLGKAKKMFSDSAQPPDEEKTSHIVIDYAGAHTEIPDEFKELSEDIEEDAAESG